MCTLGLLDQFNISICDTNDSPDSGGSPKHYYSDTGDLTEAHISTTFSINSLILSMPIPSKFLAVVTQI